MKIIAVPEPQIGDIKICRGFAIFPTKINQTTTVWFERYTREKIWYKPMNVPGGWIPEQWGVYDKQNHMVYDPHLGRGWRTVRRTPPPPPPAAMRPAGVQHPVDESVNDRRPQNRYDFMSR